MNLIELLNDYEDNNLEEEQVIQLFQQLYDSGAVHHLQGHYGRTCQQLINAGLVNP